MLKITFLPKKNTMAKPVEYLVNQYNQELAIKLAEAEFLADYNKTKRQYFDRIAVSEPRILQ